MYEHGFYRMSLQCLQNQLLNKIHSQPHPLTKEEQLIRVLDVKIYNQLKLENLLWLKWQMNKPSR